MLLFLWPGTRGFCVCRGSFPLTLHSNLLAGAAGSNVSELGLRRIQVSCQGGQLGSSYSQLLFQGRRSQSCPPSARPSVHTNMCALPLGALGSCWLGDDCPSRLLLLVAQGQHQRKTPKDCTCREIRPQLYCFPCLGNFGKNTRPSLCFVTIWLPHSVQRLLCPLFTLSQLSLWASEMGPAHLPPWSEATIQGGSCLMWGWSSAKKPPVTLSREPWSLTTAGDPATPMPLETIPNLERLMDSGLWWDFLLLCFIK